MIAETHIEAEFGEKGTAVSFDDIIAAIEEYAGEVNAPGDADVTLRLVVPQTEAQTDEYLFHVSDTRTDPAGTVENISDTRVIRDIHGLACLTSADIGSDRHEGVVVRAEVVDVDSEEVLPEYVTAEVEVNDDGVQFVVRGHFGDGTVQLYDHGVDLETVLSGCEIVGEAHAGTDLVSVAPRADVGSSGDGADDSEEGA